MNNIIHDIKKNKAGIILIFAIIIGLLCVYNIYNVNDQGDLMVSNDDRKHIPSYQDATKTFEVTYKGEVYESTSYSYAGDILTHIIFEQK